MDDTLKNEILSSIERYGSTLSENKKINPILAPYTNINHILEISSGSGRIRKSMVSRFELIYEKPLELSGFSHVEMRCCLCKNVIFFPVWHYVQKFVVNHLHFFVCFSASTPHSVTADCYRR